MKKLNPQQQLFVLAICDGKTRPVAAVEAGYKKGYAYHLVNIPHVAHAIDIHKAEVGLRNEVTTDYLVEKTKEILRYALTPVPSNDRYGKPSGPMQRQLGAANTAVFNLAKLCGLWIDKKAEMPANLAQELFEAIGAKPMKLIEHDPDDEVDVMKMKPKDGDIGGDVAARGDFTQPIDAEGYNEDSPLNVNQEADTLA